MTTTTATTGPHAGVLETHPEGRTRTLAELAVSTTLAGVPDAGRSQARLVVLDTLGVMLAALEFPVGRIVSEYARDFGRGTDASIFGTPYRATVPMAALANGTLAHGLDFDDHKHLSTHTLPAALALGEMIGADGAQVLEAYVVGREAGATLGAVVEAKRKQKQGPTFRGWYRVGVVGPVAAAVSAGKLLRLTPEQMANAIGIAASSSAGLRRNQGTMTKALHSGNSASAGVNAALLSARGFSGDPEILESPLGLVTALCLPGEAEWAPLAAFGKPFDIEGKLGVKPYPACSPSHMPTEAMLTLLRHHRVVADDVESIRADLHPFSLMRLDPHEAIATGYSLPFLLAAAVVDGHVGLDQVGEARLHDPAIRALMERVVHDPEATATQGVERVTVVLKDGTFLTEEVHEKPAITDEAGVVAKFRDSAGRRLPDASVERLLDAVLDLEALTDVAQLARIASERETTT